MSLLAVQDAEWFEAKQSKRRGGTQSNGMAARPPVLEHTKEDDFKVLSREHEPHRRCCSQADPWSFHFVPASLTWVAVAVTPMNLQCGAECCFLSRLLPVQVDTAAMGKAELGENPVAAAADLALLGGLEEEEEPKGPTMMGREARQLMLSGQGAAGLAAWKVHPQPLPALHPWSSVGRA